jgi:hypothetical protein
VADTTQYVVVTPPPRRRRGRLIGLIVALMVVVLVVVGGVAGEAFARQYATARVRSETVTALSLPNGNGVHVDLGGGSLLVQALTGRIDSVGVRIDELALGAVTGSAVLTGHGIPLDQSAPTTSVRVDVSVPAENLKALLGSVASVSGATVTLVKDAIRVETSVTVLGQKVPLVATIRPSARNGQLVLTPTSISVGGLRVSPEQLQAIGGGTGTRTPLAATICVAKYLPKALVLHGVSVSSSSLVLAVTGESVVLGGGELATKGTCLA